MRHSGRYYGDPFTQHLRQPGLTPEMFDRWLALFGETCGEVFEADAAAMFTDRAEHIARSLRIGLFDAAPRPAAG